MGRPTIDSSEFILMRDRHMYPKACCYNAWVLRHRRDATVLVSGHAAAAPPSAASNSRRPMVTVMRPSRARCVKRKDTTPPVCSLAVQGGQDVVPPLSSASRL